MGFIKDRRQAKKSIQESQEAHRVKVSHLLDVSFRVQKLAESTQQTYLPDSNPRPHMVPSVFGDESRRAYAANHGQVLNVQQPSVEVLGVMALAERVLPSDLCPRMVNEFWRVRGSHSGDMALVAHPCLAVDIDTDEQVSTTLPSGVTESMVEEFEFLLTQTEALVKEEYVTIPSLLAQANKLSQTASKANLDGQVVDVPLLEQEASARLSQVEPARAALLEALGALAGSVDTSKALQEKFQARKELDKVDVSLPEEAPLDVQALRESAQVNQAWTDSIEEASQEAPSPHVQVSPPKDRTSRGVGRS